MSADSVSSININISISISGSTIVIVMIGQLNGRISEASA